MSADNVIFRQARREDLEKIVSILADDELGQTREDPSLPLAAEYISAFQAIDTDANQLLAVIEIDGEVAENVIVADAAISHHVVFSVPSTLISNNPRNQLLLPTGWKGSVRIRKEVAQ